MIGEISALGSALCVAVAGTFFKSQMYQTDAIVINFWRFNFAAVFFIVILFFTHGFNDLIYISWTTLIYLVASTFLTAVMGETFYLKSLSLIGLSRSIAISSIYPFFTMMLATFFLGESLTWFIALGAILVAYGVYLITSSFKKNISGSAIFFSKDYREGVLLAIMAAVFWACSVIFLKLVVRDMNIIAVNVIRFPLAVLLLLIFIPRTDIFRVTRKQLHSVAVITIGGVLDMGLGSLLFLFALQHAGAVRTTILASVSPFFAVPLAIAFLKEKVTLKVYLGILLTIAGICLVYSS
jgi:DME family drug/metabolite transporter